MQANAVMYKEGTWVYERKFPGEVSMGGDLSLQRGVARGDSSFYAWMRTVAEGAGEYRVDLDIDHFHREQALAVTPPVAKNKLNVDLNSPARTYHVFEAFPTQHDPIAGTLDATSGDVSIMDLQIAYEHFTVEEHA
jgi:phage tail-like protein